MLSWRPRPQPRCAACGVFPAGAADPFCPGCLGDYVPGLSPTPPPRCAACALLLATHRPLDLPGQVANRCPACRAHPPPFDATHTLGDYAPPLAGMIVALKFGARLDLGPILGSLLARLAVQAALPPAHGVVPLPLADERRRFRGFNQAEELARPLARALALPLQPGALRRLRHGPAQHQLPRARRLANLDGAFAAPARCDGAHLLLVDDVMTTGATLAAAARALRRAGAARITNLVLARTR